MNGSRPVVMVMTTVPETLESFFVRQLRCLDEAGFAVHAVSSPGPVLEGLALGAGAVRHGVPMERRPHPVRDCVSLLHLYRLMRRVRPHIVHAHTPKAGLLGMAAAWLAGVPVRLYTVHGLPLLTRTGTWRPVLEAAERASARLATRTYVVSESVRRLVVDLGLCPAQKAFVLGDGSCAGVDIERFRPGAADRAAARARFGIPRDAVLASFVGRFAHDKGIAVLAAAWPEAALRDPHLHLLMVGEPDATDPVPGSAMAVLREHPRVHFHPGVPREQVPEVYAATDIAVLPTFREGLSQMALEAGAMGVPMLSTHASGLDAVKDGVTGLLVPPRDAGALAGGLDLLSAGPALRERLGLAARAHIAAAYSDRRVNGLWMSEYRRLVKEALPGHAAALTQVEAGDAL